jgi:hypothetical protein
MSHLDARIDRDSRALRRWQLAVAAVGASPTRIEETVASAETLIGQVRAAVRGL